MLGAILQPDNFKTVQKIDFTRQPCTVGKYAQAQLPMAKSLEVELGNESSETTNKTTQLSLLLPTELRAIKSQVVITVYMGIYMLN